MSNKLLPLGSVIYLEEGTIPLALITINAFVPKEENEEMLYNYDYAATPYPQGLVEDEVYYFNHENIAEVVHEGYQSDQHERYLKSVDEWKEKNADAFERGDVE